MDIRVLKYFLAIAQEESITRAAEKLHITQPTLSRQISDLEAELGVPLLIRSHRRIILTDHGRMLQRRALEITELADRTVQEVSSCETVEGTIHIGAGESRASIFLAEWIRQFSSRWPAVSFHMVTGNADDIQEKLDQGILDLGIMLMPFSTARYESFIIHAEERNGFLMRHDDPLTALPEIRMEDLSGRRISLISRSTADLQNGFLSELPASAVVLTKHDLIGNTAMQVLENGICALTCEGSVKNYDPALFAWRPAAGSTPYDAAAVWKKGGTQPAAIREFTKTGREIARTWHCPR